MKNGSTMNTRTRIETAVICIVFAIYLLFLARLLIFSRVSLSDLVNGFEAAERSINLIPFGSIMEYVRGDSDVIVRSAFSNVIGNIVAFIPLGAYMTLLRCDKRIARILLLIFIASLLIEIIQGVFGIGAADVDDIILNCTGGLVGILGYRLLHLILHSENRARTAIAILSMLLYYTFIIKLRL